MRPRLNSSSGSFFMSLISKAGRPSTVAVIVANVADMAHPATAPAGPSQGIYSLISERTSRVPFAEDVRVGLSLQMKCGRLE